MGPQLCLAAVPTPKVAGSGALAESSEYALGYIWAEFGAFRLISARYPCLPRLTKLYSFYRTHSIMHFSSMLFAQMFN